MNLATLAGRALRAFTPSRTWRRAAALAVSAAVLVAAPALSAPALQNGAVRQLIKDKLPGELPAF
ncbi:hypothetical protein AAFG07_06365 [Bradyrhizobium sp. B097]|uniref:hypothetical protein n=1 Tax=Bradyrhizobium sp. B097 TaxID=3140244 RepID=UPI0031844AF5